MIQPQRTTHRLTWLLLAPLLLALVVVFGRPPADPLPVNPQLPTAAGDANDTHPGKGVLP